MRHLPCRGTLDPQGRKAGNLECRRGDSDLRLFKCGQDFPRQGVFHLAYAMIHRDEAYRQLHPIVGDPHEYAGLDLRSLDHIPALELADRLFAELCYLDTVLECRIKQDLLGEGRSA